jgi:hypothetical protein
LDVGMIRIALVVILVLGVAFAYREVTKPSSHDQAVATLKHEIAETGLGDPGSVSCNAKASPVPPGYAGYGNVTLFDCSYADSSTGTVVDTCMLHGGTIAQISDGWANGGPGTCAEDAKMLATLNSGGIPSLPTT